MGIERMEHVAVLVPAAEKDGFLRWLYRRRALHIMPFIETPSEWASRFAAVGESVAVADDNCAHLASAAAILKDYRADKGGFLESLFPVKVIATKDEVRHAVSEIVPVDLLGQAQTIASRIESARETRAEYAALRERLKDLDFLTVPPSRLEGLKHLCVRVVIAAGQQARAFVSDDRMAGEVAAVAVRSTDKTATYVLYAPKANDDVLAAIVTDYGLRDIWLPDIHDSVEAEMARLAKAGADSAAEEVVALEEARAFAARWARRVDLAAAWWDSERQRIRRQADSAASPNVFAARGYVRACDMKPFAEDLAAAFPSASFMAVPAPEGEEPPVSVRWNAVLRPVGLLVRMFGLPMYRSIDPTIYLALSFLVFFGICFGDVLYGLMLIGLSWYLMRRYAAQPHLRAFFMLFLYAGISTVLFGVAMGSWASDLPKYFGETNPVERLRQKLTLLDPLAKPVVAFGISIAIGVVNQLYGIFVRFVRDARRGDWASGIYDGLFWIAYLVSLMTVAMTGLGGMMPQALKPALVVLALSALGLVLTQGRDQKGFMARMIYGVISLYGITGNYGTTSFIGDVVSYSRLLALALTTSVVGMTFNIIGGLVKGDSTWSLVLFLVIVIGGHVFNFTVSILGAFVHSARLILLEWFGRFYESGGTPFRPFGFSSDAVEVVGGKADVEAAAAGGD